MFLPTIAYYAIAFLLLFLLGEWSPSGPCTPGLGVLAFLFLFLPITAGLLCYNLYKARTDKGRAIVAAIHAFVLLFSVQVLW